VVRAVRPTTAASAHRRLRGAVGQSAAGAPVGDRFLSGRRQSLRPLVFASQRRAWRMLVPRPPFGSLDSSLLRITGVGQDAGVPFVRFVLFTLGVCAPNSELTLRLTLMRSRISFTEPLCHAHAARRLNLAQPRCTRFTTMTRAMRLRMTNTCAQPRSLFVPSWNTPNIPI